jgi:CRP-like cAMP-binding protein
MQTRRTVEFFVDYRTPPNDVIETVEATLQRDPVQGMATEPKPHVLFFGLRDSFAQYLVRYWLTDLARDDPPDSDVRIRLWYALERAGIPLAIPAHTVFMTQDTVERRQSKASADLDRRVAALDAVDLFRSLPDGKKRELAEELVHARFARGEAITREGEHDDGLYMLVEGEAAVRIGSGRDEREVARLVPGQFFGEMSLMTGEARTATVVAAADMLCYRIDKPAFEHVLRELPQLADQIAGILATRRSALAIVRDERDEVKRKRVETAKQDLLGRIRGFFGIHD